MHQPDHPLPRGIFLNRRIPRRKAQSKYKTPRQKTHAETPPPGLQIMNSPENSLEIARRNINNNACDA